MKTSELRKGNFICQVIGGNVHVVEGFLKDTIYLEGGIQSNINEGWQGIPLTEEWRLKFRLGAKSGNGVFAWQFAPAGEIINVKCDYVHQFQNLHFDLTGEEITK